MTTLKLTQIRTDGGTQSRASINRDVVRQYAEAISDGKKLPPLDVFYDGTDYWLADGFHRLEAYQSLGARECPVEIHQGTVRDAVLFSVGANHNHGLPRTNADKRRAVKCVLQDAEWSQRSNRWIAEACGVSDPFVLKIRNEVLTISTSPATRTGRDGKQYPASGSPSAQDGSMGHGDGQSTPDSSNRPQYDPNPTSGSTRVNPTKPEEVKTLKDILKKLSDRLTSLGSYSPEELKRVFGSQDAKDIDLKATARVTRNMLVEIKAALDAGLGE